MSQPEKLLDDLSTRGQAVTSARARTRASPPSEDVSVKLKVGQSLLSTTDTTTVIVVRARETDVVVTCGGAQMVDAKLGADIPKTEASAEPANGTQLGKRYEDAMSTIELLCTKGGTSSLTVDGVPLSLKASKPLPASD